MYRTYSNITGNPGLAKAIAEGKVYKEDGEYVEVEPEDKENENE